MRMPGVSASTELWLRITLYLIGRLTRDAAAKPLVGAIKPARDRLIQAERASTEAAETLTLAEANLDGSDDEQDRVVVDFDANLLVSVGKNRTSPLYDRFFPKGLRAVTTADIADEVRILKTWDEVIEKELASNAVCARYRPLLAAARTEVERQIPLHQAALDGWAVAWSRELGARSALRRQYRVIYGDLIRTFPDDRRRVESYFRDPGSPRRPPTDDAAAEEVAPEPATGSADAPADTETGSR